MANVTLQPLIDFDVRAVNDLSEVGPIDFYRQEQAQGVGALYAVMNNNRRVGSVLIRREILSNGEKQCVVVAGKVRSESAILDPGMREIERRAKANGCTSIRLHTDRIGLIRNLLKRNPDAETVVEWDL
ncbi:MAG: hypothetical protein JKY60_20185 [Kordiimonadaceae bacterium]|nr:hypothetical protein [Kordiimonadaceae bacterium]